MSTLRKKFSILFSTLLLGFPVLLAAQTTESIGELFASETTTHGPVLLAGTGMTVDSGSQVTAGKSVATLRLDRGGEIRLCPNSSITVTVPQPSLPKNNQEMMMAMEVGTVEFDYPLNDLADTLITPDFKLMLAGPGVFHFALGVNGQGDTCIKPMRGNSASLIVSEMIGTSVYQVKPNEAIMFPAGKLGGRTPLEGECGCPRPAPIIQAEERNEVPTKPATEQTPAPVEKAETQAPAQAPALPPAPPPPPDVVPVQVEAPLVFRGDQPIQSPYTVAKLKFSTLPNVTLAQENATPIVLKPGKGEVSQKNKQKKGFFGRIKGFFASLFHH